MGGGVMEIRLRKQGTLCIKIRTQGTLDQNKRTYNNDPIQPEQQKTIENIPNGNFD